MASQEYRRIIKCWSDCKLFHATGKQYHLCHYDNHDQECYRAIITAVDDASALEQCGTLVRKVDPKKH